MPEDAQKHSIAWTSTQAYGLAIVCLLLGIAVGYLLRRSSPAPASPAATQGPASQAAEAAPGMMAPGQVTPEQLKHMADKQVEPVLSQLKAKPNDPALLAQAGNVYYDAQQFKDAIDYYTRALAGDPNNTDVRTDMATALWYLGDADRALAEFDRVLRQEPTKGNALFNRGMVRWQGKMDVKGAVSDWETLLKVDPNYRDRPKVEQMLVLGLAMGLALVLKFSSITLIGILPILFLAYALVTRGGGRMRRLLRSVGGFALAMIIAAVVLWASYGFRYASRPYGAQPWTSSRIEDARGVVPTKVIPMMERAHLLPQAYLIGLQDVFVESELGRAGYLLGQNYLGGRWYYFPVAAAIKFTVPFLLIVFLSFAAFRFWRVNARKLPFLLLPVALYTATSAASGMNIGLRHVFPIVPLLAIFGAAGIWNVPLRRNIVTGALIVLLSAHAGSSLHVFPNYVSYGNELWGGPDEVYKYLADSNADWGQAQKMARSYIKRTQPRSCFLIQAYHNRSRDYGIPCGSVSELERDIPPLPFTGTLIVSSSVVDGVTWHAGGVRAARVFRELTPTAHIGGSAFLVYEGTFDLSPIIAAQHVARIGADVHEPRAVLEEAKIAARLDPENPLAYLRMCHAYLYLGQRDDAQSACNALLRATKSDVYSGEGDRRRVVQIMTVNGLLVDPGLVH